MQSFTTEEIMEKGKALGFAYESFEYSIFGKYKSSDALFNHRDIPHFNHLHANLAGGYGSEGIHYGEVVSFIRYFKFLNITFPILTLMKDDGKNRVLETFSFFCFQFLKLNEEIDEPISKKKKGGGCLSKITYYIGCKNKILLNIFLPFFKKMFKKSFNDYKNEDHPFLNRRADLRLNNFFFDKDDISKFNYTDTLNIKRQNCFYNFKDFNNRSVAVLIDKIKNNEMNKISDLDILSFQIYRQDNFLKVYHLVCPHEGGSLDIYNNVGVKFGIQNFKKQGCQVRCNVHNRRFNPIISINLSDNKREYFSEIFKFSVNDEKIIVNIRDDLDKKLVYDWSR